MKCGECEGKGFIELEHGLIMVECQVCKGTGDESGDDLRITNGDDLSNQSTGSPDTSKPKRTSKPKARKKAGKASR